MDYIEINKQLWNQKTDVHFESDFYGVEDFLEGKEVLNSIELELLGDLKGKSVLHLQCHFGMDSIALARHGAQVTAVDLSDKAIKKAQELNELAGTDVRFMQSDVYALPEMLDERFDYVFTSYGVVGWLPDMQKWASVIDHFLKPGGEFVMVEFHPVVWMFSYDFQHVEYKYIDPEPIVEELEGTYTDRDAPIKAGSVSWNHGLAPVLNALIKSGLRLTDFAEHDYSPYNCFQNTAESEPGKFQIKGMEGKLPMLYSLKAVKDQ